MKHLTVTRVSVGIAVVIAALRLLTFAPLGHGQLSCIVTDIGRNEPKELPSAPQH